MELKESWQWKVTKNSEIREYLYHYYKRTDFLKLGHKLNSEEYYLFEDCKYDYCLSERLLKDIISKPSYEKRMKKYAFLFKENFVRLNNNDGTFSFVFPSGKLIPDKFMPMPEGQGMKPEFVALKKIVVVTQDSEGLGVYKKDLVSTEVYNFVNKYGIYLLDQSKIKTIEDVIKLVSYNPGYLNQIPLEFFDNKYLKQINHTLEEYYKNVIENNRGNWLLVKPLVKSKYKNDMFLIEKKQKLYKKFKEKREKLEEIENNKPRVWPKKPSTPKKIKLKYSEQEKRALYPTLYQKFDAFSYDPLTFWANLNPLDRLRKKLNILDKKILLAEEFRESIVKQLKYLPKDNDDDYNKYLDCDRQWHETKKHNEDIRKQLEEFDIVIIQDLSNKRCDLEKKIDEVFTFRGEEVANILIEHLQRLDSKSNWHLSIVTIPDKKNITPILRGNMWVDSCHNSMKYIAVTNKKYPKSLIVNSVDSLKCANSLISRMQQQIEKGNLILITNIEDEIAQLNKAKTSSEIKHDNELPLVNILKTSIYNKIHKNIRKVLIKEVIIRIKAEEIEKKRLAKEKRLKKQQMQLEDIQEIQM